MNKQIDKPVIVFINGENKMTIRGEENNRSVAIEKANEYVKDNIDNYNEETMIIEYYSLFKTQSVEIDKTPRIVIK